MTARADLRNLRTTVGALGKKPGEIWFLDNCSDADGLYTLAQQDGNDIKLTEAEFLALPDDADRVVIVLEDAPKPDFGDVEP